MDNRQKRPNTTATRRTQPANRTSASDAARKRAAAEKRRKETRRLRILTVLVCVFLVAIIAVVVISCSHHKKNQKEGGSSAEVQPTTEEVITEPEKSVVELVAVGDVLMHTPLLNYADNGDGTYDFNSIFAVMKDDISRADIAVCNQETPVDPTVDADGGIHFIFNTPTEIVDAEINAGFDVATQASNHTYDMGWDGVIHTVDYWKSRADQIKMIGANSSQEERDTIMVYEKNGIKIAMLNYTYGLNGFTMPDDMQYLVTLIEDYNYDLIVSDIQRAKSMADFVIVFPHWGTEDLVGDITDYQAYWGRVFTEAGADLIIGTHPHVCEKIEWITADNGNRALCYYSIGNYASNQQETPEVLGGMAKVRIIKEGDHTYIDESATGVVPVVTHNVPAGGFVQNVVCYKLQDYSEELAEQHDIYVNGRDYFNYDRLNELANEIFGSWIIQY